MEELYEALSAMIRGGQRGALATVVRTSGSTPQIVGAKLLLREDGVQLGTVGGGRLEQVVLEALADALKHRQSRLARWHLTHDLGMCCGGQMEVFMEVIESAPQLVLFGAGHVAHATARLASTAGFSITVVDAREDLNEASRFPGAKRVLAEPAEAVRREMLSWGPSTYVVIATHDHRLDEEALIACLPQQLAYLGMMGSKRKIIRIFDRIRHRYPEAKLEGVHAPIGLEIGAVTPSEIGVAIVAELVGVRRKQAQCMPSLRALSGGGEGT